MKAKTIQILISISAVIIAVIHLVWPNLSIDGITLFLFAVAIIPWVAPLFKSLEFPGGWKIEFQDLQKAKNEADKVGLLAPASEVAKTPKYSFQTIADNDPNLALAGLRIEIEKRLQILAESNSVPVRKQGISSLMRELMKQKVLSQEEYSVLSDMVGMLNSAVHGAVVDKRAVDWAIETGSRLLKSLDDKVK